MIYLLIPVQLLYEVRVFIVKSLQLLFQRIYFRFKSIFYSLLKSQKRNGMNWHKLILPKKIPSPSCWHRNLRQVWKKHSVETWPPENKGYLGLWWGFSRTAGPLCYGSSSFTNSSYCSGCYWWWGGGAKSWHHQGFSWRCSCPFRKYLCLPQ